MSNTESISARLRRVADNKRNPLTLEAACEEFEVAETLGWGDLRSVLFKIADEMDAELESTRATDRNNLDVAFAEWIEEIAKGERDFPAMHAAIDRWYLPRPLFEDGEPVRFGDNFRRHAKKTSDTVSSITYTSGDRMYARINDDGRLAATDRIRRPMPKVLDADGVPIEVGDILWDECGDPYLVTAVNHDGTITYDNRHTEIPCGLTHRQPDTQERIDRDAMGSVCDYFCSSGIPCDECSCGTKDCSTEMRLDLLRRQRELDGRDA